MTAESSADTGLAEQITRLLASIEACGRAFLIREDEELLQSIVDAAARIFGAAAASIALVDEAKQALVFKVASGVGKETIIGLSTPLDHGLAGYVVMTGQPISVRDVRQDARFNQQFASNTGYIPRSILATPLLAGDQVIGVMEVLDKISAPSFGMQDMDLLGLFARPAAIAIHQSQQYDRLSEAMIEGLRRLIDPAESPDLARVLDAAAGAGAEVNMLEIAGQIQAISRLGSAEQHACLEVLQALGRYARSKVLMD